jgi:RimJ/RimL family protein N-acetyltransferase
MLTRMSRLNEWGQPIGPELVDFETPEPPPRAPLQGHYVELAPLDPERHARELWRALEPLPASHWTYLPYGPFESFFEFESWLRRSSVGSDPLFFCIIDQGSDVAAGLASYLRIQRESACIEVGHLNFSALLARRPGATEAMVLMMQQAFELGYRRYEWKCDALHALSRAAALRLGFRFEGIFRQATLYKGRSRDTAWYSVIDREWTALERAYRVWLAPDNFDDEGRQRSRLSELTESAGRRDH